MQIKSTNASFSDASHSVLIEIALLLLATLFTLSIIYTSVQLDPHTSERSLIEISQSFLLLSAVFVCLFKQKKSTSMHYFFSVLTYLFLIVLVRELDQVLELFLPHGAWKVPAALLFLSLLSVIAKNHQQILKQLLSVSRINGFMIAVIGCYIVFIFSRLAGLKEFWMMFMGDNYNRDIKTLIEEGLELFGYAFMLIGVFSMSKQTDTDTIVQENHVPQQPQAGNILETSYYHDSDR